MIFFKKHPYLYEIPLAFILLLWAAQIFYPNSPAFNGVEPHPFWIVLLLFALRYGLNAGILSALLAAGLYITYSWFYYERYLLEDFQFYILPGLFLLVGGALGLVGQKFKGQVSNLEQEKEQLQDLQKNLKAEIETQKEMNLQLEKKIVTKSSTLITLYEGARRFDNLNLEELYPAILDFILKTLEASQGLIYINEQQSWKLKSSMGFTEPPLQAEVLSFLDLVLCQKRSLSLRELLQQNSAASKLSASKMPILMGPLQKGEEGEVLGVFLIYELPFQNLNSATLNLFSFLLLWASRALGRTLHFEAHKKMEIFDQNLQVFSENYFESRLAEEFERARTYYLPLSLGQIEISLEALTALQRDLFLKGIVQILKDTLRPMDVVAYFPNNKIQFAFLLITTSATQAENFKERIFQSFKFFLEAWKKTQADLHVGLALTHYAPQLKSLEEWREGLRFKNVG
ncbi:MAG: hypothetical protein HQM15_08005 [Deltaproteobacteria bacterium]|nr:hypothetical protein [Deltaproteobacteria bacterium]